MTRPRLHLLLTFSCAALIVAIVVSPPAFGQKQPGTPGATESDESAELAKKLQNPVAALISVPFQNNFEWGAGPQSEGFKYTLNFQPVIPISISEDWNVISRTIVPIINQNDVIPNSGQTGLGDILQSAFFSPKAPGPFDLIWGVGPALVLPTSTDFLGAQKFSIGPTGVVLPGCKRDVPTAVPVLYYQDLHHDRYPDRIHLRLERQQVDGAVDRSDQPAAESSGAAHQRAARTEVLPRSADERARLGHSLCGYLVVPEEVIHDRTLRTNQQTRT
jgi:hypothetical protein